MSVLFTSDQDFSDRYFPIIGIRLRFQRGKDACFVLATCQVCQVRSRNTRCVPDQRLTTIFISTRSNETIRMRFIRCFYRVLLNFPKLICHVVGMSSIVTQFISIDVLTCRSNARRQGFIINQEVRNRRTIRLLYGAFFSTYRASRSICIVLCQPRVLPAIAFTSVQYVDVYFGIFLGFSLIVAELRRQNYQVMCIAVILQPLVRFIHGLFLSRFFYRTNGTMVVVDMFGYFKWQPIFNVVAVFFVREGVSRFFVDAGSTMVIRINDNCADFRYLFQVGISGAFRVDVRSSQGNVVTGRRVYFAAMRVPGQRTSILFMRDRG